MLYLFIVFQAPRAEAGAAAYCGVSCAVEEISSAATQAAIAAGSAATQADITTGFQEHEDIFMTEEFFGKYILAAMQDMTEQLTAGSMMQMNAIGGFFDAKQQLEIQRLFEQKTAQAHKDYQPSVEMCSIGTVAQGLGAAYRNGEVTAVVLSKHSQDRQLEAQDAAGATGPGDDTNNRINTFKKRYCDITEDDGALKKMCGTSAPVATIDKDVDFTRTLYHPLTLNIDYSDGTLTDDEQDVAALGTNLYASTPFPQIAPTLLDIPKNQAVILDQRAIIAARSVAENSYDSLVGMKAADNTASTGNAKYLDAILVQLGASQTDAQALIGAKPSYYARMELLTKKIYQDPGFYTALYDTPANLARKGAALRAISLMQHMDMFKSRLRNEAILAELVELDVNKAQDTLEDQNAAQTNEGARDSNPVTPPASSNGTSADAP